MDTSPAARLAVIGVLFVAAFLIAYFNLRMAVRLILGKPVGRWAKVIWSALGLLLVFGFVDAFYIEPDWVQVTRHEIKTPKLAPGESLRIVQLSDLHMERIGRRERRMLYLTAMQEPDIIVLTGDYLNVLGDEPKYLAMLGEIGRRLVKVAPTYAIEGNWDSEKHMLALHDAGVTVLTDWTIVECKRGAKIAVGQVPWSQKRVKLARPAKLQPYYTVLLCHTPQTLKSARAGWVDLMLAGHTHGGQVRIPIFGALMPDTNLVGKHQAGLYKLGQSDLYVSRGVGMEGQAPQVRFFCRPEIAVIDIVGKSGKL